MKFKKMHPDAVLPKRATDGAAGYDLVAVDIRYDEKYIEYNTGIGVEIPNGYVGLVVPRSSVSNYGLLLSNGTGIIDSDFCGSILFRFRDLQNSLPIYKKGDRIGQIVIVPCLMEDSEEVDELSETKRGQGGFGSTNV